MAEQICICPKAALDSFRTREVKVFESYIVSYVCIFFTIIMRRHMHDRPLSEMGQFFTVIAIENKYLLKTDFFRQKLIFTGLSTSIIFS